MSNAREIADAIKMAMLGQERHPVRFGLVHAIDKAEQLVKVELQPEGDVTPWIRYVGPGITLGNWQGVYLPPVKTEVLLLATDPDCKSYVALGGLYNGVDAPPADYAEGTILLEHSNGNQLLLDTDGTIYLGGKSGADGLVRKADLQAVIDQLNSVKTWAKAHKHIGNMGAPTPIDPTDALAPAVAQPCPDATASTVAKAK